MTLKPPRSKRIYVVMIDPDIKPKKTKSITVYDIELNLVYERVRGLFEEGKA